SSVVNHTCFLICISAHCDSCEPRYSRRKPKELLVMAHLFGEVAIGMELATPKQIEDALSRQQALRQGHAKSRLGEVLIMMNVLSVEQVKKILSEQRKRREDEQKDVGMQHFGEYKILEKLGEGGLGAVYKAVATLTGKVVAIKILLKRFSGNTT